MEQPTIRITKIIDFMGNLKDIDIKVGDTYKVTGADYYSKDGAIMNIRGYNQRTNKLNSLTTYDCKWEGTVRAEAPTVRVVEVLATDFDQDVIIGDRIEVYSLDWVLKGAKFFSVYGKNIRTKKVVLLLNYSVRVKEESWMTRDEQLRQIKELLTDSIIEDLSNNLFYTVSDWLDELSNDEKRVYDENKEQIIQKTVDNYF